MADKKKLGNLYRSVVPAPPVEEPAPSPAVVPSTPVAAPAPTPTAALPTAPTAKTPAAPRPAVRKPVAPKPVTFELKSTPTYEQVLRAATPKPLIDPAENRRIIAEGKAKAEAKARKEAEMVRDLETAPTVYGRETAEVISGDYYEESKDKLKKLYGLMPVIIREAQAKGQTLTPEQVRREAARRSMFYMPVASSLLGKRASVGTIASTLGAIPEAVSAVTQAGGNIGKSQDEMINEQLVDLQKREDFVRERERKAADPLTDRLVKEMDATYKKFKGKTASAIPAKLVTDFRRKYVDEYMVQNGYDQLTNEQERKAREEEGRRKADEALDNLRAIKNPVVSAGLGAVTKDTVRAAAYEGFIPFVKEVGSVLLPQQAVTASGAAVRTESIPMTLLRDIDIPNAVVSGFIPLPGEGRRYRGDPFLRVQRGQTFLPDVLENQWFRESIDGRNGAGAGAAAAGLLAAAAAFEIAMPGLEVAAAPAVAKGAQLAGKMTDKALDVADAIKVARNGLMTTPSGEILVKDLPSVVERTVETVRRTREVLNTTRDTRAFMGDLANAHLERAEGFTPSLVNLEIDASNPAMARVYRDKFLQNVGEDKNLNEVLDIIKKDAQERNAPFIEFDALSQNDASDIEGWLGDIQRRNTDAIDDIKTQREAARAEVDRLMRTPSTPDVEMAKDAALKKFRELTSDLSELERKKKRLDALAGYTKDGIARSLYDASRRAVEMMTGERFIPGVGLLDVARIGTRAVPSDVAVDIEDVRSAFGGALVSTEEAKRMASYTDVAEFIKNKSSKTATDAEKRLAEQIVANLENTDAAIFVDRLAQAGVRDPFEILRAITKVDAEVEVARLGGLEDDYDKLVRKQIEAEVEVNRIVTENIQAEDAALQLERTLEQLKEADRIAKQTAGDLKRARSIKVPKAAVEAIRAEKLAKVAAPGLDATSPAAVRSATSEQILNETIPSITMDADSVSGPVARQAQQADLVRTALREKVDNKTMRRLTELRHGTDRTMPYAVTGEPWNRPDYFMLPRPSSEGMAPASKAHSLKLHKERTANNNVKYIMQDGDAQRKKLVAVLKQFEAEGNPKAEGLRAYLESGSAKNDAAKAQFAQRMGIPTINDYTTLAEMFDKGGLDAVYKKFDEIAAANPDVPRARGENVYYRWLLNRSAPDGMEPGVIRMDDYVEVRSVARGKEAGLVPQHVVLPDGSTTFMSGGFVGDRFMGRVVGAVEREGKTFAVVNVYQYGPELGGRAFPMTGKTIEVPADEMILFERGRTEHVRYGTKGGEYPELRPMLESEWSEMFAREDAAFGGLKGKLAYDEAKNGHVYNDLNPPKRPTESDFDFYTEADLLDAVDRQIPLPRMEMVEGGADVERSTLVPAMEQAADVLEERPTEKVGVLGRPPAEPKPKAAAAPLTTRDRRVARMKDAAVNAALNRRDDALELLEQARKSNAETRAKASKISTDRLEALDNRINKIEAKKAEVKANIDRQRQIASAAADIERLSSDTIANVLETRRAMTQRLIDAERASKDILAQERVIAKEAGEVGRKPVSLDQEVKEEIRRIAASEGGVSEFIRGVRRLGSSARETVEGTLSADLRQVIRRIDRNRAEAEQIIRDGLAQQGNIANPREALVVVLQKMNDSQYGDAWASATANKTLNKRAVDGVAFSYINDITKLTDDEVAGLRKIVVENTGDLNELSQKLYNYSFDIFKNRERAVGDIQMAQSVATQTIIDKTLADAFGLGALFNREDALAVNAWLANETGRNAARGRQLILSVMASAVDTGVPIRGIEDMMNDPTGRKILRAVDATGAEIAADASAGSAFAASMDAFSKVYAGSAFLPEPLAVELNKVMNDMIGSTRTRNSNGWSVLYKKEVVYGVVTPRTTFYFNNAIQDADGLAVAEGVASKESRRAMVAGALNMVLALPGVSIVTGLVDAIRNVRAGTSAEIVARGIANVENWLGLSAYGTQAIDVMNRSGAVIDGVGLSGQEMWRIGSEAGVGNTIQSSDIVRTLEQQFDTSLATWRKTIFTKQTDEIGALITERKRWGAFISVAQRMIDEAGGYAVLGRAGVEAKVREAARITTEALMDYSATLHPIERGWFFNIVAPFWSFEKSNMIRVGRLMTTDSARLSTMYAVASSGYKFGVWTRKKEVLAEIASFLLENRDDYGFDVEAMKKDDEARPEGEKLYPMYEQAIEQAKTAGLDSATVRGFGAYMTDDRLEVFNPFLDYNIPNAPLYMEPDQFSKYRTPFAIIVGDAKLQSWAMYNDYLDPKNKFGDQDMFTYIQPPDDANLFALSRAVAGANLMAMAAKGMLNIPQEKVAQSVSTNLVDLVGNPLGFNPLIQAVGEVVMQSYDKENAVSIAPMRVSDNVGKMLKSVGLATLENKVVDVDMQQTEFGSTNVKVEPGYYVPKHTAVALRSFLPGMVSIMGTASNFEEAIEIGSNLVTEQDERRRKEFIDRYKKLIIGMSSKSVSVQQVDARAEQQIVGDVARYGMGAGTRLKTPLTPEQIRSEALQRAGEPTAEEVDTKRRFVYTAADAESGRINESDLRLIALKDGFATEEEMKTLSRYDLIDRIKSSKQARSYVRVETARYLSEMTPDVRDTVTKNAIDRTARNIGDGRTFAIVRTLLSERGIDVDSMTDQQIRNAARKMRAQ
jgi:hypothetical protein